MWIPIQVRINLERSTVYRMRSFLIGSKKITEGLTLQFWKNIPPAPRDAPLQPSVILLGLLNKGSRTLRSGGLGKELWGFSACFNRASMAVFA
mmetsp:Transcript_52813/g.57306  ORF Transcript_52813/g.57306 Transcript_52813/m.57306 type:complete len:93 (-) Transcript_52813:1937-2215(-)